MLDLEFIVSDELFPRHSEELSGANANFGECEREMATVCYDKPNAEKKANICELV